MPRNSSQKLLGRPPGGRHRVFLFIWARGAGALDLDRMRWQVKA
jgi:hypothetical protein